MKPMREHRCEFCNALRMFDIEHRCDPARVREHTLLLAADAVLRVGPMRLLYPTQQKLVRDMLLEGAWRVLDVQPGLRSGWQGPSDKNDPYAERGLRDICELEPMHRMRDAVVLFLAINGPRPKLTCQHIIDPDEEDETYCGKPMVGVSADDGSPLCAEHVKDEEEAGYELSADTIYAISKAIESCKHEGVFLGTCPYCGAEVGRVL